MTSSVPDVPSPTHSTPMTETQPNSNAQAPEVAVPLQPAVGWTLYAEQINGRFAMVGFLLLLLLNWFTIEDIFTWLGLR